MTLRSVYDRIQIAARVDAERAQRVVGEALPCAVATLGGNVELDVRAALVPAQVARGGSVIPAWPYRDASGAVTIEYVDDWGALLATWLSAVEDKERALALDLVTAGQRVWIGIANDVLQLFVTDPPDGMYSMVRHHALMLAAATSWLGPEAVDNWRRAHASAARAFVARHAAEPLWTSVGNAERGLDALLLDPRCRQSAADVLHWLDSDAAARLAYTDFLGAASLGVAAVLRAMQTSETPPDAWLQHAVATKHCDPDFNKRWIEAYVVEVRT